MDWTEQFSFNVMELFKKQTNKNLSSVLQGANFRDGQNNNNKKKVRAGA